MSNTMPGIDFSKEVRNPTVDSKNALYEISLYKDADYFSVPENMEKFISKVEDNCRRSKYYKRYVKFIREEVGLNNCQVFGNIEFPENSMDSDITLEMHHGPILTLYDYVLILIDYLLNTGCTKITTMLVSDMLMKEHYEHHVEIVMLSKTAHEAVDEGLFVHYKQGFGQLHKFIENYKEGLSREQVQKINSYIEFCEDHQSFDNGLFILKDKIKYWAIEELI